MTEEKTCTACQFSFPWNWFHLGMDVCYLCDTVTLPNTPLPADEDFVDPEKPLDDCPKCFLPYYPADKEKQQCTKCGHKHRPDTV